MKLYTDVGQWQKVAKIGWHATGMIVEAVSAWKGAYTIVLMTHRTFAYIMVLLSNDVSPQAALILSATVEFKHITGIDNKWTFVLTRSLIYPSLKFVVIR